MGKFPVNLSRFIIEQQAGHPAATGEFSVLLTQIGMVGKIIHQRDAAEGPHNFQPPLQAAKVAKGFGDMVRSHTQFTGHGRRRQGVGHIMFSRHPQGDFRYRPLAMEHLEAVSSLLHFQIGRPPFGVLLESERHDAAGARRLHGEQHGAGQARRLAAAGNLHAPSSRSRRDQHRRPAFRSVEPRKILRRGAHEGGRRGRAASARACPGGASEARADPGHRIPSPQPVQGDGECGRHGDARRATNGRSAASARSSSCDRACPTGSQRTSACTVGIPESATTTT